jgi:cell division protein FtsB
MFAKIKNLSKTGLINYFSDVRNLGLLAFGVIAMLVTWSGIKVVQTNYDLQRQMSAMQQENEVKRLENSNLELSNQYYETDQYLELAARKQYNKALPGEKLLIVPSSVALAHTKDVDLPDVENSSMPLEESGPWYERNFNAWMEFLFRKES